MNDKKIRIEYQNLIQYLRYTLHELPLGVLYDSNGADEIKCKELMENTYILEKMSNELGVDNNKLLVVLRWHYERYPHYLSRQKHFGNYEYYIKKYNGPLSAVDL